MKFDLAGKRVYVAGHTGMVGSAVARRLASESCEIVTASRAELDLTNQTEVLTFVRDVKPNAIVMAAAKVGGILANETYPAEFLNENLVIETNVIGAAHRADVNRMLFLGSSCIYPKFAPQPIKEDALLTGPLEKTNQWYAVAKIAGLKLAEAYRRQYGRDYISAMPTNLYGVGDNFDLQTSHVMPALIRKVHIAKIEGAASVEIWGSGTPRREFLHADDCADALVFLLQNYSEDDHINVGSGEDITIRELAQVICEIVGFSGKLVTNTSMPDGTPRKLMSAEKLQNLGWKPKIPLREGIESTYKWFLDNVE